MFYYSLLVKVMELRILFLYNNDNSNVYVNQMKVEIKELTFSEFLSSEIFSTVFVQVLVYSYHENRNFTN